MIGELVGAGIGALGSIFGGKGKQPRPGGGRTGRYEHQNEDLLYALTLGQLAKAGGPAQDLATGMMGNDKQTYERMAKRFGQNYVDEAKNRMETQLASQKPGFFQDPTQAMSPGQIAGDVNPNIFSPGTGMYNGNPVASSISNVNDEAKREAARRVMGFLYAPKAPVRFGYGGGNMGGYTGGYGGPLKM